MPGATVSHRQRRSKYALWAREDGRKITQHFFRQQLRDHRCRLISDVSIPGTAMRVLWTCACRSAEDGMECGGVSLLAEPRFHGPRGSLGKEIEMRRSLVWIAVLGLVIG